MAASKPRLIRNDLVTDADLARFQHASGSHGDHDPCPVADKALFLDAMMSLIFRNERKRLAETQAATGQIRLQGRGDRLKPQTDPVDPKSSRELSKRSARRTALPALASPARAVNFTCRSARAATLTER
jgi:hypothetical protein